MNENKIQPFFIFGSPRSGTSLLSRMIDSHEHLVVPNESLIFKMFSSSLAVYGDLNQLENQKKLLNDILATRVIRYWSPTPKFEEVAPFIRQPGFAGVIEALICSRAPEKELLAWGEKSPGHVFYWADIKAAYPNAKVVHIIRDGRDVASSIINARMGPKTYFAAANMWCDYLEGVQRIKQDCAAEDFIEIRYEDLLADPKQNLQKICDTLNVNYSESMLKFFEKDASYQTDATNLENLNKPIIATNKEKWRKNLSDQDLQEFETVAGKYLSLYGYEAANTLGELPTYKLNIIRYITSPTIRFFSRAKDTQGQKEFLSLKKVQLKRKLANLFNHVA